MAAQILTWMSMVLCVLSFAMFVYFSFALQKKSVAPPVGLGREAQLQSGLSDIAKLVEALSKLADSFARAGPAVMSLVASILFLLVAALGAGLERIAPTH